jgi:hypothetical protein
VSAALSDNIFATTIVAASIIASAWAVGLVVWDSIQRKRRGK